MMNKFLVPLALVALLAGCQPDTTVIEPSQQGAVIAQPPVVVQQSDNGFFTGMLMGHLMSGGGGGYSSNRTVTKNVTINKTVIAPRPSYSSPYRSYSTSRSYSSYGRR